MTSSHRGVGPWCLYRHARLVELPSSFVKILKPLARLSLQVIDGSKVISPSFCLAHSFHCFRVLVRDSPSGGSCLVGLCLGGMRSSLVRASMAHLCGLLHPRARSFMHSWHAQFLFLQCVWCWAGWRRRADVLTRSVTLATWCFSSRHFAVALFMGFRSAERWYHAGSCADR